MANSTKRWLIIGAIVILAGKKAERRNARDAKARRGPMGPQPPI
jgi:hypothetical protein